MSKRQHLPVIVLTLLVFVAWCPAALPAEKVSSHPEFDGFVEDMVQIHGFEREVLVELFQEARLQPRIIEIMERPRKQRPAWKEYRSRFVNAARIEAGLRFWTEHAEVLSRARERFGVPEHMITAIIGVETHYGRQTGRFSVLEALATLAFDYPARSQLFRRELEHYLLLTRDEATATLELTGSYAGAMGIAQFLPSSYRRYGVDFDGDGKRDLVGSFEDAIGSVANYLAAHGWKSGSLVAVPAEVTGDEYEEFLALGFGSRRSVSALEAMGVTSRVELPAEEEAMLVALSRTKAPEFWLGLQNFYVITRYNRSTFYAMAVYQLSQELDQRHRRNIAGGH